MVGDLDRRRPGQVRIAGHPQAGDLGAAVVAVDRDQAAVELALTDRLEHAGEEVAAAQAEDHPAVDHRCGGGRPDRCGEDERLLALGGRPVPVAEQHVRVGDRGAQGLPRGPQGVRRLRHRAQVHAGRALGAFVAERPGEDREVVLVRARGRMQGQPLRAGRTPVLLGGRNPGGRDRDDVGDRDHPEQAGRLQRRAGPVEVVPGELVVGGEAGGDGLEQVAVAVGLRADGGERHLGALVHHPAGTLPLSGAQPGHGEQRRQETAEHDRSGQRRAGVSDVPPLHHKERKPQNAPAGRLRPTGARYYFQVSYL